MILPIPTFYPLNAGAMKILNPNIIVTVLSDVMIAPNDARLLASTLLITMPIHVFSETYSLIGDSELLFLTR